MREILFRGKVIGRNQWVYGHYFISPLTDENSGEPIETGMFFLSYPAKPHYIIVQNNVAFSVDPETVGQYTGLNDKTNAKIFEHDFILSPIYNKSYEVLWSDNGYWMWAEVGLGFNGGLDPDDMTWAEVIGNRFDNPELVRNND